MRDIEIIDDFILRFKKKLWHETEILLAKCFGFPIDIETGVITCDIRVSSKKCVFEFIKLSFKNFSESPMEEDRRNNFYGRLQEMYQAINDVATIQVKQRVPYYDRLFQHQKDVINESFYKQFNFLAMEMGTGKTISSASLSRVHGIRRTIIICPSSVKWNWYRDLVKNFGYNELYFSILDSKKSRCIRAFQERFVIVNYDMLAQFEKELCNSDIGHFIIDEADSIKNHNSQRSKNLRKIIEQFPGARITFLSGTPVRNRVNDVFNYLKIIGHELGSSYKKFLDEYTIKTTGRGGMRVTGGRNLQDLHIKLSNFMIRKTKAECLDLPEKIYIQHYFEIDDYREEYNKVIEELSQRKEISSLTGNLHSLNIITSKAKIKGVIELAESIIEEGKKVVIFGSYTAPIEELEMYFKERCVKITGEVDAYQRDQLVQQFHNDPECEVFLGNMIAAGVGINLTNASDVIFLNYTFTPAGMYQAMDRLHRIGQKSCVNVHYTMCEDSIDSYIHEIIIDKQKDISVLIDNGEGESINENVTEQLIKKLLKRDDLHVNSIEGPLETTEGNGKIHTPTAISNRNEGSISSNTNLVEAAKEGVKEYYVYTNHEKEEVFVAHHTADFSSTTVEKQSGMLTREQARHTAQAVSDAAEYTFAGFVDTPVTKNIFQRKLEEQAKTETILKSPFDE